MDESEFKSIAILEENGEELYEEASKVILRIAKSILDDPVNTKYRSIYLGSKLAVKKLIPIPGAIQCLLEMGYKQSIGILSLPRSVNLDNVKEIHDLLKRKWLIKELEKNAEVRKTKPKSDPVLVSILDEVEKYVRSLKIKYFFSFIYNIDMIWKCERPSIQIKALKHVPMVELKRRVVLITRKMQKAKLENNFDEQIIDCQELFLYELCKWFKTSFFKWVTIQCHKCRSGKTTFLYTNSKDGRSLEEIYRCGSCKELVVFPRYNDPEKLLESRSGRCGEWVHVFYLICRSLGWDVRYVVDVTDHVWVEIYSYIKNKWIHCDPCENLIDAPLIYESGWKKSLSYIMAFSKDDIQDVTWRYTSDFSKVLQNRNKCTENQLTTAICHIRNILLKHVSEKRKEFVMKRAALELVNLLTPKTATEAELRGRSSGSLAWRLARGEITIDQEFKPFIWQIHKERQSRTFRLSYCTAIDKYYVGNALKIVKGWQNGLYRADSVFRKIEDDWEMTYLARKEGCTKGKLVWRFEAKDKYVIGNIEMKIKKFRIKRGRVICRLSNTEKSITLPEASVCSVAEFKGSRELELSIELSGGSGECAWQHAQVFRQSLKDRHNVFEFLIYLDEVSE